MQYTDDSSEMDLHELVKSVPRIDEQHYEVQVPLMDSEYRIVDIVASTSNQENNTDPGKMDEDDDHHIILDISHLTASSSTAYSIGKKRKPCLNNDRKTGGERLMGRQRWRAAIDSYVAYSKWLCEESTYEPENMPRIGDGDETVSEDDEKAVASKDFEGNAERIASENHADEERQISSENREDDYFIGIPVSQFVKQFELSTEETERMRSTEDLFMEIVREYNLLQSSMECSTSGSEIRSEKDEILVCFGCGRVFGDEKVMRDHINETHLANKVLPYKCKICHKHYKRKQHLKRHEETVHSNFGYVCDICSTSFRVKSSLIIHKGKVHKIGPSGESTDEACFICQHCKLSFYTLTELARHKFYCLQKNVKAEKYRVQSKAALMDATKPGQSVSAANCCVTPFGRPKLDTSCPYCLMKFASMQSVKRHIGRKHPGEGSSIRRYETVYTPDLPYACNICAKRFVSSASLSTHKRRHNSERSFKCSCGKAFLIASELRKHQVRVHGKNASEEYPGVVESDEKTVDGSNGVEQINYDDLSDFIL